MANNVHVNRIASESTMQVGRCCKKFRLPGLRKVRHVCNARSRERKVGILIPSQSSWVVSSCFKARPFPENRWQSSGGRHITSIYGLPVYVYSSTEHASYIPYTYVRTLIHLPTCTQMYQDIDSTHIHTLQKTGRVRWTSIQEKSEGWTTNCNKDV